MESALPLNLTAFAVCENLVIEGQPLTVELGLLAGSSATELFVPMSGTTLLSIGMEGVTLSWTWNVVLASTGQSVDPGEALSIQTTFEEVAVTGAFGKFSSELSHPIEARMAMPELTSWDPALFYLSAPRLMWRSRTHLVWTSGINITELALLSGDEATLLQGPAIDNFPNLAGASAVE